jgi:D-alanine-D-alanine ligase
MPLFVKPLRSDASLGIGGKSLVHDAAALMERVAAINKELEDSALAEEYIDGREFYVGVLGNTQPKALPPIEVDFTGFPEGVPKVMDSKAKWDEKSKEYKGTKSVVATLPDELRARLQKVAVDAYRALRVKDYGRVDLRLTDTGDIYVLEVNASCYLEKASEFAMAATASGLDYPRLIERIVNLASERFEKKRR